ncbi:MAG: DUF4870 domain-containing protein [Deltaproteobacteria bacterium]|nr:DUF4870 domain-containing protein [Deltaproteobacteria bacterium]
MTESKGSGLAPNIASVVAYLCAPITSVIMILVEKENKEVQFHAWQGTAFGVVYIGLVIALEIVSALLGAIISFLGVLVGLLVPVAGLAAFVLWIICLVKAYQGERWKIPYIGDFAARKAGLE